MIGVAAAVVPLQMVIIVVSNRVMFEIMVTTVVVVVSLALCVVMAMVVVEVVVVRMAIESDVSDSNRCVGKGGADGCDDNCGSDSGGGGVVVER